jgi:hypothetical protein
LVSLYLNILNFFSLAKVKDLATLTINGRGTKVLILTDTMTNDLNTFLNASSIAARYRTLIEEVERDLTQIK